MSLPFNRTSERLKGNRSQLINYICLITFHFTTLGSVCKDLIHIPQKTLKITITTSLLSNQHPNAGRNIQHLAKMSTLKLVGG